MSFFGLQITSDSPIPFRLDDGGVFNLKRVILSPGQENTGKVYLMVNIPFDDEEYEDDEGKIDMKKFEDQIPVCVLESGKIEQENLDLNFPWTQDLVFSVIGKPGVSVYLSGSMDSLDDDEDCDDENCQLDHHHDGEDSEDDEEFLRDGEFDSDDIMDFDDESESDEEPPVLVPINNKKKATIIEIEEAKPITPDTNANGKKNNKKNKKTEEPQKPAQPEQKPAKQQPKEKQAKPQPQQPQQPKEKPAKQQPKEKQAKPQPNNKKRDLNDKQPNNNATKKSKNSK